MYPYSATAPRFLHFSFPADPEMTAPSPIICKKVSGFPAASAELMAFGLKFSSGGSHISRTMMLVELRMILAAVPRGALSQECSTAILDRNVIGKTTVSTRQKSLRHLRELYALDEGIPIFGLLRKLHELDPPSLPLLAVQVAWARDPLFRATAAAALEASEGDLVVPNGLAAAIKMAFPNNYSELNCNKIARNAASSWTQSGHLLGRSKKIRHHIKSTAVAVTMALFLGQVTGYHGESVFSNPWCHILDLNPDRAKGMGFEAHRAGLLNLRTVGEVVELNFPLLAEFLPQPT